VNPLKETTRESALLGRKTECPGSYRGNSREGEPGGQVQTVVTAGETAFLAVMVGDGIMSRFG